MRLESRDGCLRCEQMGGLENNVAVFALGRSRKVRLVVTAMRAVMMELSAVAGICLLLGIMHYCSLVIVNGMVNDIDTNAT